jgi:hypothetical protein
MKYYTTIYYNGTVHQLFIDFKKAYDSVTREVFYKKAYDSVIREVLYNII